MDILSLALSLTLRSLSGNGIDCEGCRHIAKYLKDNNSLQALILDDNPLGLSQDHDPDHVPGIQLLANILPNAKKLCHLSLQNNQISDQSLSKLAESLETNRTLSYLG
jgi:Ran GTPase-activating protein (RanGAP) involved in mRNA processing and transport